MENKTIQELKNYCRDNNISGFSKYTKKQELLHFVNTKINDKMNLQVNQPMQMNMQMNMQNHQVHQDQPNEQVDQGAELAKLLYESEKEYYIQKQNESIQKQKEEFMKQQAEQDEINRLHNLKKIEEAALMKLEQEQEYEESEPDQAERCYAEWVFRGGRMCPRPRAALSGGSGAFAWPWGALGRSAAAAAKGRELR